VRRIPPNARPAIASAVAALIVYAITLAGTFIYDDFDVFANDPRLHVPAQWWKYWTESYNGGVDNLYRPLVSMTYAVAVAAARGSICLAVSRGELAAARGG
jgi:hypothetical protein